MRLFTGAVSQLMGCSSIGLDALFALENRRETRTLRVSRRTGTQDKTRY